MTCVDVMYQPLTAAFPAYPRASCSTDFSHSQSLARMQEPLDLGPTSSLSLAPSYQIPSVLTRSSPETSSGTSIVASPSTPRTSSLSSSSGFVKLESEKDAEPKGAEYLTANCVLLTYFSGDTASVVDDHFTRALSSDAPGESKSLLHKAPTPMSARNLPPSFWNSSYQHQHHFHHFLGQNSHHHSQKHHSHTSISSGGVGSSGGGDPFHASHPYLSPALHGLSNLQSDPWSYSFSTPTSSVPYPHRPVPYDFSYPSTTRLSQNYSSFLVQPSAVRSAQFGAMSAHCDVTKQSDHSRSRYSDHRLGSEYQPHHSSFSAIDATGLQEATKDLYWF